MKKNTDKSTAIDTIIFDFDGTVIDTNRLIEEGLGYFALKYRGSTLTQKELSELTGKTLEDQMAYIKPDKADIMVEQFKIWYIHNHDSKTHAFAGMKELLAHLKVLGYRLALVSNNSKEAIEHGLRHLDLSHMFDMIVTRNDVSEVKPSPEGLLKVMRAFKLTRSQCIYIGDTAGDIKAAKAAEIQSVMVGWTHLTKDQIFALEPGWVLNVPNHLFMILDEYILEGNRVAG
ncbi:MAG TPA: hypothetical protein DCS67_08465 [Clostridiales bacterium UBA8960]|nr:hypothetical protein [Clostridiales bacterium UBA8960]